MTTLDGAVVLITGANGGLGREFVRQALARGARQVLATARAPPATVTRGRPGAQFYTARWAAPTP